MNIRESMEQWEIENLSPYAAHSAHSRGRERTEEELSLIHISGKVSLSFSMRKRK